VHPPSQPRYRRPLSFGDTLDEGIRLYRAHFTQFVLVSAIGLLPSGLILVGAGAAGLLSNDFVAADLSSGGRFRSVAALQAFNAQLERELSVIALTGLVSAIFGLIWTAAVVVTSDTYFHDGQPTVRQVFSIALRRFPAVLLSTILLALGLLLATVAATALAAVTLFLIGGAVALVGLIVWWLNPGARKLWLKWLIILSAPYGLPAYLAVRWSLYLAAIVLERRGPVDALSRSTQLTAGLWFRVAAILTVAPLLVGILVGVISALIEIPLGIVAATRGQVGLDASQAAISSAVNLVLQILFSSVAVIVYALLFNDLRNRREGIDIVERLSQIEPAPVPANG
jgi:hypothetical protein